MNNNNNNKVTYALIGFPVGHSFSARYFNDRFEKEGLEDYYKAIEVGEISALPDILAEYPNLKGMNVTSPWKERILEFLTFVSKDAQSIRAVNTVKVLRDSGGMMLYGFNTDVYGFQTSLQRIMRPDIKKGLVFGSGGASRAVGSALKNLGIDYELVSRTRGAGKSYDELTPDIIRNNHLLINATPLGMGKHIGECPDIPYEGITERHICYDLIYNPEETEFLKRSRVRGAEVKNGLEMLHLQADKAWEIWNKG